MSIHKARSSSTGSAFPAESAKHGPMVVVSLGSRNHSCMPLIKKRIAVSSEASMMLHHHAKNITLLI